VTSPPPSPPAAPRPPASLAARLWLLVASVGLTLGAVELATRYWIRNLASDEQFLRFASLDELDGDRLAAARTGSERRYTPHRYLGYYPTPGYVQGPNRHNSLGFRGDEIPLPKPAGEFRIVCIGGSTTYTGRVEDVDASFPVLLERELRERGHSLTRVVNAGGESWTSWESLINLETRVVDLAPDLIVNYDGINDLHARLVWPPEAYRADNSGRRAPIAAGARLPGLLEHSAFGRVLLVSTGRVEPHSELGRTLDPAAATWYYPQFQRQWRSRKYPRGRFVDVPVERMLAANPPLYFRRNLASQVAVARAHGAETVLATFADARDFPREVESSPAYQHGIAEMNAVVRDVAAATGATFFDFAAVMPRGRAYFADSEHVNAAGSAEKARLFAEFLARSGLLPRDVASPP